MFRRTLDAGGRPSAVVFDLAPHLLAGGPRYWNRQWTVLLSPREIWQLVRSARGTPFTTELVLFQTLPSLRSRFDLRIALNDALANQPLASHALNAKLRRNWTVNDGANVAIKRPEFRGEVSEDQQSKIMSNRFSLHRVNREYARRTLALARARGVRPYLLLPPLPAAVIERRRASGAEDGYLAFLHQLQNEFPELTILDGRGAGYPTSVFVDDLHLDRDGASLLSRDVGAILRADRDGLSKQDRRWVAMASYRDIPGGAGQGLEDVEQSKQIITAGALARR